MKRDMDLCREILLKLEEQELPAGWLTISIPGRSDAEVDHHVRLLAEAGLIDAADLSTMGGVQWKPTRLTWVGHEFLEAARNDTAWQRAKKTAIEKTGSRTLEILPRRRNLWVTASVSEPPR